MSEAKVSYSSLGAEKVTLGFLADVLYLKGVLCIDELNAVNSVVTAQDLEVVIERMFRNEFGVYKRGEMRSAWSKNAPQFVLPAEQRGANSADTE